MPSVGIAPGLFLTAAPIRLLDGRAVRNSYRPKGLTARSFCHMDVILVPHRQASGNQVSATKHCCSFFAVRR